MVQCVGAGRSRCSLRSSSSRCQAMLFAWYDRTCYDEFNEINERSIGDPGVRIVRSGGNHDITYEDLYADLDVTGKGRLDLYDLTLSSYDHGVRVGSAPRGRTRTEGDQGSRGRRSSLRRASWLRGFVARLSSERVS